MVSARCWSVVTRRTFIARSVAQPPRGVKERPRSLDRRATAGLSPRRSPMEISSAERLHALYELNRRLATFTDLDDLLRHATQRARELLHADGCALLLFDPVRRELHFPVASQAESRRGSAARLAEIRFPADRGIAGWVLAHGEAVRVEDVQRDGRFYGGVDQMTDMVTR